MQTTTLHSSFDSQKNTPSNWGEVVVEKWTLILPVWFMHPNILSLSLSVTNSLTGVISSPSQGASYKQY